MAELGSPRDSNLSIKSEAAEFSEQHIPELDSSLFREAVDAKNRLQDL
jgi:hypothetical protein